MLVSSFMNSCCQKSLSHLYVFTGEDPDERRGQVLMLLAEQALRLHDYKAASVHCQELMATGEVDNHLAPCSCPLYMMQNGKGLFWNQLARLVNQPHCVHKT